MKYQADKLKQSPPWILLAINSWQYVKHIILVWGPPEVDPETGLQCMQFT